jgi:hypothetical protein
MEAYAKKPTFWRVKSWDMRKCLVKQPVWIGRQHQKQEITVTSLYMPTVTITCGLAIRSNSAVDHELRASLQSHSSSTSASRVGAHIPRRTVTGALPSQPLGVHVPSSRFFATATVIPQRATVPAWRQGPRQRYHIHAAQKCGHSRTFSRPQGRAYARQAARREHFITSPQREIYRMCMRNSPTILQHVEIKKTRILVCRRRPCSVGA